MKVPEKLRKIFYKIKPVRKKDVADLTKAFMTVLEAQHEHIMLLRNDIFSVSTMIGRINITLQQNNIQAKNEESDDNKKGKNGHGMYG